MKKIILFITLIISVSNCSHKNNQELLYTSNIKNNFNKNELDNQYKIDQNQINAEIGLSINEVKSNPVDIVDDILQTPLKNLNIGIVAPMTGKYASIGKTISESAMLAVSKSKYQNAGNIKIYNIGQITGVNFKDNKEVQRLLKDDNDVIIGLFFENTIKNLIPLFPEDKLFIGFINKEQLAKEYPNLVVMSMDESYKINSLFQYLLDNNRKFLSILLPATKTGYANEKLIRKLAPFYKIMIVNIQFYQPGSKISLLSSTRGIKKNFSATYLVDENGEMSTETYKDWKAKQKKLKQPKEAEQVGNESNIKQVDTNAIYIDANENDLLTILNGLENNNILNTNVQIFSNAIINPQQTNSLKLNEVYYIGYNYNVVNEFNDRFINYFKRKPNYTTYMTYDTILMLQYLSNEGKMLPRKIYNEDGFRGILDEFNFTREGNVMRRFSIYHINETNMTRVYIPNDYIPLNIANNEQAVYKFKE